MAKIEDVIYCDGCGIEIIIEPYPVGQWVFCCRDCASWLACDCGERMDQEDDHRSRYPAVPTTAVAY